MIHYPYLKEQSSTRQVVDKFKGYNHNLRIGSGEFYEMENLTSDDYPVLSVRKQRGLYTQLQENGYSTGMMYVPGCGLFLSANHREDHAEGEYGALYRLESDGQERCICSGLLPGSKSLALMGKYLIIAPDMKWVRTDDLTFGNMFEKLEISVGSINLSLCMADGTLLDKGYQGIDPPSDPQSFSHWVDTSTQPPQVKRHYPEENAWFPMERTYVRLACDGFSGNHFQEGDGIHITGLGVNGGEIYDKTVYALNGCHVIHSQPGSAALVVEGVITAGRVHSCQAGPVRIERRVPELDFVVEYGNRLWGCNRGTNEIYASKLGDPFNWNCFQGVSTDSWVGSIGTPGEFTGAVVQNGYPVFYKENCKHKVWPSATGAHQITTLNCNGVEQGSEYSLAVLDGTVFYKSSLGVFADDGGGAVEIGQALGNIRYCNAVGAVHDCKYYLSMEATAGKRELFVYDIAKRMWHRENGISGVLCAAWNSVFTVAGGEVWDLTGNTGTPEEEVSWMAVTGDLGLELPEQKYISRLTLRLSLDPGATLEIYAQYDREQTWVKLGQVYGTDLRSFSLPVRPRRCDQLRLKLQGTGMCKIYSITETLERGSELP